MDSTRKKNLKRYTASGRIIIENSEEEFASINLIAKINNGSLNIYGIINPSEKLKEIMSDKDCEWTIKISKKKIDNTIKPAISKAREILEAWNSENIIIHKETPDILNSIVSKLKNYSDEEIKESIKNYAIILKSKKYFWTYKWTLKSFLQRGIDRFLTRNNPFSNFIKSSVDKGTYYEEL